MRSGRARLSLREPSWFFVPFVLKTDLLAMDPADTNRRIDQNTPRGRTGLAPFGCG
jgi:hypothetical protein